MVALMGGLRACTLRYAAGQAVGEGDPVIFEGRALFVDSWSVGAGLVWLRDRQERGGAELLEVRAPALGWRIDGGG
jgi:hypothetical protein